MNAKKLLWPVLWLAVAGCVARADLDESEATPGSEASEDTGPQFAEPPRDVEEVVYGPVYGNAPGTSPNAPVLPPETVDAGTPDAGTPGIDAGTTYVDAGAPYVDAGTPYVDAGAPYVDAGTPYVDAGTPAVDAGAPVVDGGTPGPTWTKDWWVSSTSGNDTAAGTSTAPFKTINRAMKAAAAGERILVRAGTYREQLLLDSTKPAGTALKPILLQGIDKPKIVPPGAVALAVISRPNWIIDGFDFDAEDLYIPGIVYSGDTAGNVLRYNLVHGGRRNGIVVHQGGNNITIEHNQIYDWWHDTNDAHGIGVLWTARNVTIRHNKISQNSGDSVQCEGPEPYGITDPPGDNLVIENNEFTNDKENAVDIKTCSNVVIRNNWAHDYRRQGGVAFVIHMSAKNVFLENNLTENVGSFLALGGNRQGPLPTGILVRRNRTRNLLTGAGLDGVNMTGRGINVANSEGAIISNNTFAGPVAIGISMGDGTNGPTNNLLLQNNIIPGVRPVVVGPYAPGLISKTNLFDTNRIQTGGAIITVQQWQTNGVDNGSKVQTGPLCDGAFTPVTTAVNSGSLSGLPYCGSAPDIGAVETGC